MYNTYDYYITPGEYEIAERNGIRRQTVEVRIRRFGWGKQKAITDPPKVYKDRTALKALLKQNGIPFGVFQNRIYCLGWDEQTASTTPLRDAVWWAENARRAGEKSRKYPREMVELAARNGIPYARFRERVADLGWSYELAATKPVSFQNGVNRCKELYGENFFSISHWNRTRNTHKH